MERGIIVMNAGIVAIPNMDVWMTDYEIAHLFGVTLLAVNNNIKSIYKSGILEEYNTYRYLRLENGNRADAYNMDLITTVAFRLSSFPAATFREWVIKKVITPVRTVPPIILQLSNDNFLC